MTKYSLERGTYRTAGDKFWSAVIRVLVSFVMAGFLIWLKFVFDFQFAVLFGMAVIIVTLWSIEAK